VNRSFRVRRVVPILVFGAIAASMTASAQAPPTEAPAPAGPPIEVRVTATVQDGSVRLVLTHDRETTKAVLKRRRDVEIVYTEPVTFTLPEWTANDLLEGWKTSERRLRLKTGKAFGRYERFDLKNPDRLILDLRSPSPTDRATDSATEAPSEETREARRRDRAKAPPTSGTPPPEPSDPVTPLRPVDDGAIVVVIDPGHGGRESGATAGSLKEKDVTLALARRLRARLRGRGGIRVVLTRDEDRTLPHDERTAIANQNRADLFISLHVNASPRSSAYGAETYYLSAEATDDEARTAAALENRSFSGSGGDDLDLVLWDLAQNRHLARSSALAESIQRELNALVGTRDRGVRQAPFRVLMGATMPAVLVEVGFISNKNEAAKLGDPGYQERVVESIGRAVESFLVDWRRVIGPTGGP